MADDQSCCDKIMHDIACREERRLIRTLFFAGPLLIVCAWLVIVAIHLSITSFLENEALRIATDLEEESRTFSESLLILLNLFWSQLRNDLVILLALALTLLTLIVTKTKLFSFPFRVREIKKFKILEDKSSTTAKV
jgi:hypothetical protein